MNAPRRRRQPRTACDTCRRRKTRCDIAEKFPCSVCAKSRLGCKLTANWPPPPHSQCGGYTSTGSQQQEQQALEIAPLPSISASPSAGTHNSNTATPAQQNLTPSLETQSVTTADQDNVSNSLARTGLSQFFQRGVNSMGWLIFQDSQQIRLAYIGTATSNLAHLVNVKRPLTSTLHFPYPPIRPALAWKPESIWGFLGNIDIANDIASFPAKEIRDAIVDAYFQKIHPGFPIIEESMFRRQYSDPNNPPPLLLFQGILLAGAHVCDHPTVAESRMVVKKTLFRRASMLFHIHHENDRLHMAQAALLFTWHLENADNVCSGSYYWLGVAHRIAYGIGVHRDPSRKAEKPFPEWERRICRRTWWTMFQAEAFSCLEHGRPCIVNPKDFDQPPLELQDLVDGETDQVDDKVQFEYCVLNIRLSYIILRILEMNCPNAPLEQTASDLSSIESLLADLAFDLPTSTDFWSCQIRMHYNLILLHLHRNFVTRDQAATLPPSFSHSREMCSDAAQAILACLETIVARSWVCQCSFTGPSAVMAAAIQITVDARAALAQGSALLALSAQNRLARLLDCAKELEKYWPSAGAVHGLFDELSEELKHSAKNKVETWGQDLQVDQAQPQAPLPHVERAWENAFGAYDFALTPNFAAEEWMNDTDFFSGQSI